MSSSRLAVRNPFPIPDVSTEGFWIPPGPVLGAGISVNDRRWSSRLDAHERLFAHHTLNSIRRDNRLVRTKVPRDALDLALTSTYVHNEDTLVPKMYVCMQPEALGRETWRVLRNELKTSPSAPARLGKTVEGKNSTPSEIRRENSGGHKLAEHKTRAKTAPARKNAGSLHRYAGRSPHAGLPERIERIHPSSLKLGIDGPHTDLTNPGYSRKEDGTFYAI